MIPDSSFDPQPGDVFIGLHGAFNAAMIVMAPHNNVSSGVTIISELGLVYDTTVFNMKARYVMITREETG